MPPPIQRITLTEAEEDDIRTCRAETRRPYKIVYFGNFRNGQNTKFNAQHGGGGARSGYRHFHNVSKGYLIQKWANSSSNTINYTTALRHTILALVPRGDNKFSYRFTEALSAGAIPVYHGDEFVFPYRPELIDWTKCAILFPERMGGTPALKQLEEQWLSHPTNKLCQMRNYCYFEIYKKYVDTPQNRTPLVDGLIQGLELMAKGGGAGPTPPYPGLLCNETTIQTLECNRE